MKNQFAKSLADNIVTNLEKNADIDTRKIVTGLIVTAAVTAMTTVTKIAVTRSIENAIRQSGKDKKAEKKEPLLLESQKEDEN